MSLKVETRERMLRKRASSIGLRTCRRGTAYELRNAEDGLILAGSLDSAETYVAARFVSRVPGPTPRARPPAAWAPAIDEYLTTLVAAGQPHTTLRLRRFQLTRMACELGGRPADVTGAKLVAWLGRHPDWSIEYRRGNRAAARMFFLWAYRAKEIPVHIADDLPKVRQGKAFPRPAPDNVWRQALSAADARTMLILRLAGEAGLRRAEISCIHVGDLTESCYGAQLLVHGKGGKPRTIPISDSLADAVRAGAAGHTPGASATGWLFPGQTDGHLSPDRVGRIISRLMPAGWTLHTGRHRFATRAYRGSRNLRAVQTMLGHSSIATTERYLAVDDGEVRAAMLSASETAAVVAAPHRPEAAGRLDDGLRQTHTLDTAGEVRDKLSLAPDDLSRTEATETTFESVISGWDAMPRCEVSMMATHQGPECRRVARWHLNLHGCLQLLMCGHDLQAWKRRQLSAISRSGGIWCVHCGKTFDRFEDACSITRL